MLKGKTVLLGVTGGIAAYKSAYLASALIKQHADVHVLMTENAANFISPLTFETLTGNRVCMDTFDRCFERKTEHIALADMADIVVIAPATANVLAKLACGIADDMLTTTVLACDCPKLAAPAMNTRMYDNPATIDNLQRLTGYGWELIEPETGRLACGAVGKGRMAEPEEILESVIHAVARDKDMRGMRILVTAGPTRESLDPVRYITNHSTGKMGYAIARAAATRGAEVTLVSGPVSLPKPAYVNVVDVTSASDMFRAVTEGHERYDIIIKAAAVADYRPAECADDKIKKKDGEMSLALERTADILSWLGSHRVEGQFLCGFSMETRDMEENSRRKLDAKNVDMIAANSLRMPGAGFGTETNVLTLITHDGSQALPMMSKDEAAHRLLSEILKRMK